MIIIIIIIIRSKPGRFWSLHAKNYIGLNLTKLPKGTNNLIIVIYVAQGDPKRRIYNLECKIMRVRDYTGYIYKYWLNIYSTYIQQSL